MTQSLAGYIRQHLDEIETRIDFGTSQSEIVQELNALGYSTTIKAFRNYLSRARVWRDGKSKKEPAARQPAQTKSTSSSPSPSPVPKTSAKEKASAPGFSYQGSPDDEELSKLI